MMRAPMVIVIVLVLVTYSLCERNFKVERGQMSMPNAQCSKLTYRYLLKKETCGRNVIGLFYVSEAILRPP